MSYNIQSVVFLDLGLYDQNLKLRPTLYVFC